MTIYYVDSAASGSNDGSSKANAYTSLQTALSGKVAGDKFYVNKTHVEANGGTSITLTVPGTALNPTQIICVDFAGSTPPVSADLSTGALLATTANNSVVFGGGVGFAQGLSATGGDSTGTGGVRWSTANSYWYMKNCAFKIGGTGASLMTPGGATTSYTIWDNCTAQFSSVGQVLRPNQGFFEWKNTPNAIPAGSIPTQLVDASGAGRIRIHGVDLSAINGSKAILQAQVSLATFMEIEGCKINAATVKFGVPTVPYSHNYTAVRLDSAGTNYRFERVGYLGTETTETTIVRTGGASDNTQSVAKKIVTTANASPLMPFEAIAISDWCDFSGASKTVTIEGIWGGGAVPNNDDIWIEVEYLGDASSPKTSFVNCGKSDVLASNAALSTSAAAWGGSTTAFKMAVSFTPAQKGELIVRVFAAKPSTTFYVDPKVTIS